ncbi:MAG TPA: thioredoxin domain-containing protein, partial [Polyangiaceae bacterium]|nr:thioredoxin domain-containing protein [Polyangiaceae bacterium]
MNARWLVWTTRALLVLALGVSAALLADYSSSSPAFCSAGSGCDTVRRSGLGYIPLGGGTYIPVPVLGLIGFGLALAATLLNSWRLRRMWSLGLLAAGGFLAAALIGVQAWLIGEFCSLCVMVDTAALAACAAAVAIPKQAWETTTGEDTSRAPKRYGLPPTLSWAALAALGIAAPYFWPKLRPAPPVPPKVAAFYQPGKINVVEFADFECPFCRRLHSELKQIISDYPGKVHFVRLHMPLERHERARPAARAAVCATRQNHEESMADYLFAAENLDDKAILEGAKRVGLDLAAFKSCLTDPATDRSIDEHVAILRDAGFQGLPTTYVGASKIVGAQPEEVFRDAFDQAGRGQGAEGIPAWLYWPIVLIVGGAVLWFGRFKGASQASQIATS